MFSGVGRQTRAKSFFVSIPDRVLGVFRRTEVSQGSSNDAVSIPDRVLGVFRLWNIFTDQLSCIVSIPDRVLGVFRRYTNLGRCAYLRFNP